MRADLPLLLLASALLPPAAALQPDTQQRAGEFLASGKGHSNNWAVLVCTSRFWFNYRHVANVLSLYHSVKRLGIPDRCNPRNPRPGTVYNNAQQHINLYGEDVEVPREGLGFLQLQSSRGEGVCKVDYRGYEVTVENFVRVLTGRLPSATPRNKRLLSSHDSNILVYLTGHGGHSFLKFQDAEELTSQDIADAIEIMWGKQRYHEMLLIVDTCQAATMYSRLYSPNVLATGSSLAGEDSLSHHLDKTIGVFIIDRYTYYILQFLQDITASSKTSVQRFLDSCPKHKCISTVGVRYDLYPKDPTMVPTTDFLASVRSTSLLRSLVALPVWLNQSLPPDVPTVSKPESSLVYAPVHSNSFDF